MGPTSIGRDEAVGPAEPNLAAPGVPEDQVPGPAEQSPGSDVAPASAAEADEPGTDPAPVRPARPRFRPPRARSRRPEPEPFTAAADASGADPAAEAGDDGAPPGMKEVPGTQNAQDDTDPAGRSGRRGRPSGRSRTRQVKSDGSPRLSGVAGWKVATAVLTAVAVLAVGWGVYQTTKLNRTESALKTAGATASSQIQSLDSRTAALEAANSQTASDLAALQQQLTDFTGTVTAAQQAAKDQYAKVQESLSVSPAEFKTAVSQSAALSTAYLTAKAAADAAPADQESQVKSLEAKSILLANCTRIWAGAAQQIYTADNPQEAMSTIGKDLATVAGDCKAANQ